MNVFDLKNKLQDLQKVGYVDNILDNIDDLNIENNNIKNIIIDKPVNIVIYNKNNYVNIIQAEDFTDEEFDINKNTSEVENIIKKLKEKYSDLDIQVKYINKDINITTSFYDNILKNIYADEIKQEFESIDEIDEIDGELIKFTNFKKILENIIPIYRKDKSTNHTFLLTHYLFEKYLKLIFDINSYENIDKSLLNLKIYQTKKTIKTGYLYTLILTQEQYDFIFEIINSNKEIEENNKKIIDYFMDSKL